MLNRLAVQQDRCSRQRVELCRSLNTKTIEKTKTEQTIYSLQNSYAVIKLRLIFYGTLFYLPFHCRLSFKARYSRQLSVLNSKKGYSSCSGFPRGFRQRYVLGVQ